MKQMDALSMYRESLAAIERARHSSLIYKLEQTVDILCECFEGGGRVLVFGNGGSAADAQHICGELVGKFLKDRRPLSAIALTTDTSILTAWSNDYTFDTVFLRQIEAHGRAGDVAWGISTSGNSQNVMIALKKAQALGLVTIGLFGNGGGECLPFCDCAIAVDETHTPRIQEIHVIAYHIICALVEERLFGNGRD